jgi:drug/metabolite transporter (DMT)-like permease
MPPLAPRSPTFWLFQQPYLLLSLTSLFWAINIVAGRYVAGHIPPVALSTVRWGGSFLIVLPFAWPHLRRDWTTIAGRLPLMVVLSVTGITTYNTLAYMGLKYTEALNGLLIQSTGPLFVALWSFVLLGMRLTAAQTLGIALSMIGALIILLHGDFGALLSIDFNIGDVLFAVALAVFGIYSALISRRPRIHALSFLAFITGCGTLFLFPFLGLEIASGRTLIFDMETLAMLLYVVIFPSTLAYLFYNRGVELVGPNRSAPFSHLVPVFGSVLAILFLGERPQLFHALGYALVLAGVFIAARKSSAAASGTAAQDSAPPKP